jgi:hypothetical protein
LLDEIAVRVRARLQMDANALPLAKVLEGGTWAAGQCSQSDADPTLNANPGA